MKKYNLRIPENLQIILNTPENEKGLIIKIHSNLWIIFHKNIENLEEYGFKIINPNSSERSKGIWGLTEKECTRLINKLIKNPEYGFGKTEEELTKEINKLLNKIKQTYVQ